MTLRDICGGVLELAFCLIGCFLLITFGIWTMMTALGAQAFGVILAVAVFPSAVRSEARVSCSLSGEACGFIGLAPAASFG